MRRKHVKLKGFLQMNPEKRTILPGLAFKGFSSRYQKPTLSEGFQDITEVAFKVNPQQ
jgi:bifunctional polynucleotide phosphatase/kinase